MGDEPTPVCAKIAALLPYSLLWGVIDVSAGNVDNKEQENTVTMSEIVNLRRARKNLARAEAEQNAAAQRLKFGRTKAERAAHEARERKHEKTLDGHRRVQGDET